MKVFRVQPDVNHYQKLFPEDDAIWSAGRLTLDCASKLANWVAPPVYVLQPKLKRGNFFGFAPGGFVADAIAVERLRDLFEASAELLPLPYRNEELFLINVTGCFALLDESTTKWEVNKAGVRFRISKYGFNPRRMIENPLFKLPETCRGELFTADGLVDAEDEFKFRVENAGLTGLLFKEVWRSD